jgi:hypothetical protein
MISPGSESAYSNGAMSVSSVLTALAVEVVPVVEARAAPWEPGLPCPPVLSKLLVDGRLASASMEAAVLDVAIEPLLGVVFPRRRLRLEP